MSPNKKGFVIGFGLGLFFALVALHGRDATRDWTARTRVELGFAPLHPSRYLSRALSSPDVARLNWLKTKSDPLAPLEKEIQIDFSESPDFIGFALAGDDPRELTVLVTAVKDAYVHEILDAKRREQEELLVKLQQVKKHYDVVTEKRWYEFHGHVPTEADLKDIKNIEEKSDRRITEVENQMEYERNHPQRGKIEPTLVTRNPPSWLPLPR
jgi:hypothetical protein